VNDTLFIIINLDLCTHPPHRVADVGKRNGDRTALPAPGPGLAIRSAGDEKSLAKRIDIVGLYNSIPPTRLATVNSIRNWDLPADQVISYGATYCYGCVVVVIASGQKLVIGHLPEVTGTQNNWRDDDAFEENIKTPLENALDANADNLGSDPQVMIFGPTPVPSGDLSNRDKINELITLITTKFCAVQESNIVQYAYLKKTAFNADPQNVDGKVTVSWVGPSGGQGTAELLVWAEANQKIHAYYDCQNGECLWSVIT
jgi:hypothetical protein